MRVSGVDMKQEIDRIKEMGRKPILYIDKDLTRSGSGACEFKILIREAKQLGVPVAHGDDLESFIKTHNLHVFRYGYIAPHTEASIKKRNGTIVSGNFKVPEYAE